MTARPSILCPIDFSETSRAALGYAVAIADHVGARLTVVTVEDPLLFAVAAGSVIDVGTGAGPIAPPPDLEQDLRRFCQETLDGAPPGPRRLDFRVSIGKPAEEILRTASEVGAELIVMSSRGRSGVRKLFFGSTTERVLRETSIPVLVTPDRRPAGTTLSALALQVRRVIAPVDLSAASPHQVTVASRIALALGVPLLLAHVMEPVFVPASVRRALPGADAARRADVEDRLRALAAHGGRAAIEPIVVTGDPSEEIVRLADTRDARLIVMGLHSGGVLGARMGSVTYRVLCLAHSLVLALPPTPSPTAATRSIEALTVA